jgi:hypothetical protein
MGRCLVCKLYDPAGLGDWINRKSITTHLAGLTHRGYVAQRAHDEKERRDGDARREAANVAPQGWTPISALKPMDIDIPLFSAALPMFNDAQTQGASQAFVPDKLGLADVPPVFDIDAQQQLLRDEVELLLKEAEDEDELGLWNEEEDKDVLEEGSSSVAHLLSHLDARVKDLEEDIDISHSSSESKEKYAPWPNELVRCANFAVSKHSGSSG